MNVTTHRLPEWKPKNGTVWVALDYDDTYTSAPEAFDALVIALKSHGHRAYFVTFRNPADFAPVCAAADRLGIGAIATDGVPKMKATDDLGISIDIWIDDMPEIVLGNGDGF